MALPIRTADIGIDPAGNVQVYVPPNVNVLEQGSSVGYGPQETLPEGATLGPGTYLILSGDLEAINGPVTYQVVTITT
jgi:hypothetical protein